MNESHAQHHRVDANARPDPEADSACGCKQPKKLGDRFGLCLSAACAVHCIATPLVLALTPAIGQVWADHRVHVGLAILVAPLAIWMTYKGFRRHQRIWVPITAGLGIALVLGAFAVPGHAQNGQNGQATGCPSCAGHGGHASHGGHGTHDHGLHGHGLHGQGETASTLLPPLSLHSGLTMAGGLFLVAAHAGNMSRVRRCRTHDPETSQATPVTWPHAALSPTPTAPNSLPTG